MICQALTIAQSHYQEVPVYQLLISSGIFLYVQMGDHTSRQETGIANLIDQVNTLL